MSVSVSKADGVTMFTFTYDSQSAWPPLFQILKSLCYSPVCCTVSKHLSGVQRASQTVLGALQIMVGLLSIGLGVILSCAGAIYLDNIGCSSFPYVSGALFILFGIKGLLFEKFPTQVILNMILYLTGFGIAMAAIVLYTMNMTFIHLYSMGNHETNPEGDELTMMVKLGINLLLIVSSGVEVGVTMTSAFLEIKALHQGQNMSTDDSELYKPMVEEVTALPVV